MSDSIRATRFPPDDDPGWYETNVWDCPSCGLRLMAPEVETCLVCDFPQPEGAVYLGRCWGMRVPEDAAIKLTELPARPLIRSPRDQSLASIQDASDKDVFDDL